MVAMSPISRPSHLVNPVQHIPSIQMNRGDSFAPHRYNNGQHPSPLARNTTTHANGAIGVHPSSGLLPQHHQPQQNVITTTHRNQVNNSNNAQTTIASTTASSSCVRVEIS